MRSLATAAAALALAFVAGCDSSVPTAVEAPKDDLAACLERPGLARPPAGHLPCGLLPPGFRAAR